MDCLLKDLGVTWLWFIIMGDESALVLTAFAPQSSAFVRIGAIVALVQ